MKMSRSEATKSAIWDSAETGGASTANEIRWKSKAWTSQHARPARAKERPISTRARGRTCFRDSLQTGGSWEREICKRNSKMLWKNGSTERCGKRRARGDYSMKGPCVLLFLYYVLYHIYFFCRHPNFCISNFFFRSLASRESKLFNFILVHIQRCVCMRY